MRFPVLHSRSRSGGHIGRPSVNFVLLCLVLAAVWLAGGASRGEVAGQVVVRGAAWAALVLAALFGRRPSFGAQRPVALILAAAVALTLVQLIPLPPALWQQLPGRAVFAAAATLSGQPQPWRPLAIVPGAAANAAMSLIVPAAIIILVAGLTTRERARLPLIMLAFVTAAALIAVMQAAGVLFTNILINDTPGDVSGMFANRNHFALLAAIGCLIAPVWAFSNRHRPGWRGAVAHALVIIFVLAILASGSRAGLMLGGVAIVLALLIVRRGIRRTLAGYPRWMSWAVVAGAIATVAIVIALSIAADRATSIQRMLALDAEQDLRARTLPTVLMLVRHYFPVGTGFGGFDPVFRLHEPLALLKVTFFNHAHDDFLEIIMGGGLPALVLLLVALGWYALTTWRVVRSGDGKGIALLGAAIILLVCIASVSDYPARTPIVMTLLAVAATWLADRRASGGEHALPSDGKHL